MDCKRCEYDVNLPVDPNRPQYELLPSFTPDKQLKAYELFFPLLDEAVLLKQGMSDITKSTPDKYEKESRNFL